jgi:TPR repeat protein
MATDMGPLMLLRAACLGSVLAVSPAAASGNRATDQESQALLLKIEQQLTSGHFITPADDNAVSTWEEYLARTAPTTPATTRELTVFAERIRDRSEQVSKGNPETAAGLKAFADMADSLLAELRGQPSARQMAAGASSSAAVSPPVNSSAETLPPPKEKDTALATPVSAPRATLPSLKEKDLALVPTVSVTPQSSPSPTEKNAGLAPPVSGSTSTLPLARNKGAAGSFHSRGDALLAVKDISGARKFYEYAANLGDASAAMALARTFDPDYLSGLGVMGLQPNSERAVTWYRKAAALGNQDAEHRLQAMGASQ